MKKVYVNEQWCLGCHLCEYNCAFANSGSDSMVKALKDKPIHPRIQVEEENGVCYPIEIKQNSNVSATETSAFQVLDKLENKKRGMGAVICNCPQPGMLRENVLLLPVWYI